MQCTHAYVVNKIRFNHTDSSAETINSTKAIKINNIKTSAYRSIHLCSAEAYISHFLGQETLSTATVHICTECL
jgi:hypothetical protein